MILALLFCFMCVALIGIMLVFGDIDSAVGDEK